MGVVGIVCVIFVFGMVLYLAVKGGSVFRPDFKKIDDAHSAKFGVNPHWNSTLGKIVYYLIGVSILFALLFIVGVFLLSFFS